jgi:hypothetical protein
VRLMETLTCSYWGVSSVSYQVKADGKGFLRGLSLWFLLAIPSTYTNNMVRLPPSWRPYPCSSNFEPPRIPISRSDRTYCAKSGLLCMTSSFAHERKPLGLLPVKPNSLSKLIKGMANDVSSLRDPCEARHIWIH